MTERTSERIWRAAQAAYESRGQLKVFMPWDDLRQVSRDIEYDAMVAAFGAVGACSAERVVEAVAQSIFDRAERTNKAEAERDKLDAAYVRLRKMIPGAMPASPHRLAEEAWVHTEACLKRLVAKAENDDGMVSAQVRTGKVMLDRIEALEAALKPFAEYAERIEKKRPDQFHDGFAIYVLIKVITSQSAVDIPMAWFIAALKAYRGKPAPPAEDKT